MTLTTETITVPEDWPFTKTTVVITKPAPVTVRVTTSAVYGTLSPSARPDSSGSRGSHGDGHGSGNGGGGSDKAFTIVKGGDAAETVVPVAASHGLGPAPSSNLPEPNGAPSSPDTASPGDNKGEQHSDRPASPQSEEGQPNGDDGDHSGQAAAPAAPSSPSVFTGDAVSTILAAAGSTVVVYIVTVAFIFLELVRL